MIDTSQILTPEDQYAFSLFDVNLIDFDLLECNEYGDILLPLNMSKITYPEEYFNPNMWFVYDPTHNSIESLIIEEVCFQKLISCASTIFFLGKIGHPDYNKYAKSYGVFISNIQQVLKHKLRSIMTEVKGEFVNDNILEDTYFQKRNYNQQDIYYIINKWWNALIYEEVNFVDVVNGKGTVYIARIN